MPSALTRLQRAASLGVEEMILRKGQGARPPRVALFPASVREKTVRALLEYSHNLARLNHAPPAGPTCKSVRFAETMEVVEFDHRCAVNTLSPDHEPMAPRILQPLITTATAVTC